MCFEIISKYFLPKGLNALVVLEKNTTNKANFAYGKTIRRRGDNLPMTNKKFSSQKIFTDVPSLFYLDAW